MIGRLIWQSVCIPTRDVSFSFNESLISGLARTLAGIATAFVACIEGEAFPGVRERAEGEAIPEIRTLY